MGRGGEGSGESRGRGLEECFGERMEKEDMGGLVKDGDKRAGRERERGYGDGGTS